MRQDSPAVKAPCQNTDLRTKGHPRTGKMFTHLSSDKVRYLCYFPLVGMKDWGKMSLVTLCSTQPIVTNRIVHANKDGSNQMHNGCLKLRLNMIESFKLSPQQAPFIRVAENIPSCT